MGITITKYTGTGIRYGSNTGTDYTEEIIYTVPVGKIAKITFDDEPTINVSYSTSSSFTSANEAAATRIKSNSDYTSAIALLVADEPILASYKNNDYKTIVKDASTITPVIQNITTETQKTPKAYPMILTEGQTIKVAYKLDGTTSSYTVTYSYNFQVVEDTNVN